MLIKSVKISMMLISPKIINALTCNESIEKNKLYALILDLLMIMKFI